MLFRMVRHGEKSAEGGLTENGAQTSNEVGKEIITSILRAYSSPVSRVQSTIANLLEGAEQTQEVRARKWLGLGMFSEKFTAEWNARQAEKRAAGIDAEIAQDETAQAFLDQEFESEKPLNIAKPFLKKVLFLMKRSGVEKDERMIVLGTHQTVTESIIHSLVSEIPEEWKKPLGYSEYADFEIVGSEKHLVLKITLRGISKEISQETIQNILYGKS